MTRREPIDTGGDERHIRRDDQGRLNESDDVGRSLSQDRRRDAQRTAKKGEGDRGDHGWAPFGLASPRPRGHRALRPLRRMGRLLC